LVARGEGAAATVPVIGFLDFFGPSPKSPSVEAFRAGLADGSFIDGAYEAAVAKMAEGGAGGMIFGSFVLPNLEKVVPLAALHKLPTTLMSTAFCAVRSRRSYPFRCRRNSTWS
jgi:hypothetical protein